MTSKNFRILVIDDEEIVRQQVAELIRHYSPIDYGISCDVRTAGTLGEMNEIVASGFNPDVIFLDNNFEHTGGGICDGLEIFAPRIATLMSLGMLRGDTKVVMLTAGEWLPDSSRPRLLDIGILAGKKGIDDVVPKPYTSALLMNSLGKVLSLGVGGGVAQ